MLVKLGQKHPDAATRVSLGVEGLAPTTLTKELKLRTEGICPCGVVATPTVVHIRLRCHLSLSLHVPGLCGTDMHTIYSAPLARMQGRGICLL